MGTIPHKKLTKLRHNSSKAKCDKCKKEIRVRYLVFFKGKYLCGECRQKMKNFRIQDSAFQVGRGKISLKDALARTYEIRTYRNGGTIIVPICLLERYVKLKLVSQPLIKSKKEVKDGKQKTRTKNKSR